MKEKFFSSVRFGVVVLALVFGLSNLAFAQEETVATITGQVTDSTGAAIPNAAFGNNRYSATAGASNIGSVI